MQEGDDGRGGRQYALPGGHLEFGETLALCMSREVYEECGLNVEADKLLYVHENFYTLKDIETHEIGFYFLADLNSEFPTPDAQGYVPSLEAQIRMRLLPLARLKEFAVVPPFLAGYLAQDAPELFVHPTRHLIEQRE
jgi:ADP-ribose pyrophosphatase YjhB (NUDIX family)